MEAMKREKFFLGIAIVILMSFMFSIFAISNADFVRAVDIPNLPGTEINIQDLPKSPDEVGKMSLNWLEKKWNNATNESKFIASINKWNMEHQTFFRILFGQEYSLSFKFIFILILWVFVWIFATNMFSAANSAFNLIKNIPPVILGLLFAIILGFFGFVKFISEYFSDFIMSQESFTMQLVYSALFIIILILLIVFSKSIYGFFAGLRREKRLSDTEEGEKAIAEHIVEKESSKNRRSGLTKEEEEEIDEEIREDAGSIDRNE